MPRHRNVLRRSSDMLTLTNFLQDLIVSGTIVYVTYCFMRFTAYCLLWLIGKLPFKPGENRRRHAGRTPRRMLPKT